jgi:hypothetical protein
MGLPVFRALSLCTCCRHYPGAADGRRLRSVARPISLPRYDRQVGPHDNLFEVCSAFSCVAACTPALSPARDTLSKGFSHFVTSMTAPLASGGSEFAGWDLHPLENAVLSRRTSIAVLAVQKDCGGLTFRCGSRLKRRGRVAPLTMLKLIVDPNVWTGGVLQEENVSGLSVKRLGCSCHHGYERAFDLISRKASNSHRRLSVFRDPPLLLSASTVISALASAKGDQGTCVTFTSVRQRSRRR